MWIKGAILNNSYRDSPVLILSLARGPFWPKSLRKAYVTCISTLEKQSQRSQQSNKVGKVEAR